MISTGISYFVKAQVITHLSFICKIAIFT